MPADLCTGWDPCGGPAELGRGRLCDHRMRHGRGRDACVQFLPWSDLRPCEDALDAYTFAQINDGNAIAIPFAKGFGWGGDLNLEYIFEKLYVEESGQGYPRERAVPEQRNKKILDEVKTVTYRSLTDILRELDRELVKGALSGAKFQEYFFANCKDEEIASVVKEILGL